MRRNSRGGRERAHGLQAGRRGVGALGRDVRTAGARGEGASGPTQGSVGGTRSTLCSARRCIQRASQRGSCSQAVRSGTQRGGGRCATASGVCIQKAAVRRSARRRRARTRWPLRACTVPPLSSCAKRVSRRPAAAHAPRQARRGAQKAPSADPLAAAHSPVRMCSLTGALPPPAPPAPPLRQPRAQRATPPRPPGRCSRRWCTAAAQGQTG